MKVKDINMINKIAAGVPFFLEHEGFLYECEVEHKRATWANVRIKLHETKFINCILFKIKKDVIAWEHFYSNYEEIECEYVRDQGVWYNTSDIRRIVLLGIEDRKAMLEAQAQYVHTFKI